MDQNNDTEINQTLTDIIEILQAKPMLPTIDAALDTSMQVLQNQLKDYLPQQFTYEFLDLVADLGEEITKIRLEEKLSKLLSETQLLPKLNQLVAMLNASVYQHQALADFPKLADKQGRTPVETAHFRAEAAAERASAITAAATQANEIGEQLLARMEAEQQKGGGLIPPELFQEMLAQTIAMYVKNTAAVLAEDEATALTLELETLLKDT